jgi:hypothetical protein
MAKDRLEWDVVVEAAHISQLHEKEKCRCCILQASHNRMGCKSDQ